MEWILESVQRVDTQTKGRAEVNLLRTKGCRRGRTLRSVSRLSKVETLPEEQLQPTAAATVGLLTADILICRRRKSTGVINYDNHGSE